MTARDFLLMAEDEANDALLVTRVLRTLTPPVRHHVVSDGEEAIAYLTGKGQYADRDLFPVPTILLLDLKMPRKGGMEVLQWLREHPAYAVIPTIVWTSSRLPEDIKRAYELGANCFLVKPCSLNDIRVVLEKTFAFWRLCEKPIVAVPPQ